MRSYAFYQRPRVIQVFQNPTGTNFASIVDPNWWQRFQYAGNNPTVVMDFANNLYYTGTGTITDVTQFVNNSVLVSGSGLFVDAANITAKGVLLSAFQGGSGYHVQAATFGAPVSAGANIGILADNDQGGSNGNGILMNINSGGFLTFNGSASVGLDDASGFDWTKTNYGAVSITSSLRRFSDVGTGASTTGATGAHSTDTNGYASPTTIFLGSWDGSFFFDAYIAQMSVINGVQLPDKVIPPPAFTSTNGWWWNGDQTNSAITYGNILQFEYTQPWTCIVAFCLFAAVGGGHNGVSGIFFTNVIGGAPFTGYEFWPDGNGNLTVRVISATITALIDVHGGTNCADGKWHVAAATYNGSGLAAGVQIYIDGVPETMTVVTDNLNGGSIIAAGQDYILGNQQSESFALLGAIGLFRMYNQVKTQQFIQEFLINHIMPSPVGDATCVLAPALNEGGSNTTTADLSSGGHTGTLNSSNCWLRG